MLSSLFERIPPPFQVTFAAIRHVSKGSGNQVKVSAPKDPESIPVDPTFSRELFLR